MKRPEKTPLELAIEQRDRFRSELAKMRRPPRPLPDDHPDVVFYENLLARAERYVESLR